VDFLEGISALLIFYVIAIAASLVLVVQIALAMLGFDDVDTDLDVGDGMGFLSLRALVAFFGGLGWTGVILLDNGASLFAATAAGIGVGIVLMLVMAMIIRLIYSFQETGTIDLKNALGEVGTVYITVPPEQSGTGRVRVMVQGRLTIVAALTAASKPIPSERKVRVRDLVDSRTLLVEPLGEPTSDAVKKEGQ
jgi:hypothetical protein